jgi:hypothetical protein
MLVVAALLHRDAIKTNGANALAAVADRERLRETFACRQLDTVAEAAALIRRDKADGYQ